VIIAEIGLHTGAFHPGHLVSWAKISPQTVQSGAKNRSGKTGKGNPYLKGVLDEAAASAGRTDTFLGERYRRLARRRGKLKAKLAIARSILIIAWHLLADRTTRYQDLGAGHYASRIDNSARPATTSANSKPSATQSPSPRQPDHRATTPGSADAAPGAAVRPAQVDDVPVSSGSMGGGGQQLGRGQAYLVTDSVVAGDGQAGLGGGTRVQRGQQLGRGQAYLVTDSVVAGDGQAGLGGVLRVVGGELLGRGQAVFIAVVFHGSAGFLCGRLQDRDSAGRFTRRP
jgi:hypothetical protein